MFACLTPPLTIIIRRNTQTETHACHCKHVSGPPPCRGPLIVEGGCPPFFPFHWSAGSSPALSGYHVRSLLICVRIRSSLLSAINHTATVTLKRFVQIKPAEQQHGKQKSSEAAARLHVMDPALTCPRFGWRAVSFG